MGLKLDNGNPVTLTLSSSAFELFKQAVNDAASKSEAADDWERPILSKLPKHVARLALILQLFEDPNATEVTEQMMTSAIEIAWWFYQESFRVRIVLGKDSEDLWLNRLEAIVDANGGKLAPRDLIERNKNRFPTAERAAAELDLLVKRRPKQWKWCQSEPGPEGGRPSRWIERNTDIDPPVEDC